MWPLLFALACAGAPVSESSPEQRVRVHIASIPGMQTVTIARDPALDSGPYIAVSVVPANSGLAGEIVYLVGPDAILSNGRPSDFDRLMAETGVGEGPGRMAVEDFALRFMRLRMLRRGVLLTRPDGHPLVPAGSIPEGGFAQPEASWDASGARFRFWWFDTERMEPSAWDVTVAPDGTTSATER